MRFPVYSVRDEASNMFGQLTIANNDISIERSIAETIFMKRDPIMAFKPQDFVIYKVGEFDTEKGTLIPSIPVIRISSGSEVFIKYVGKAEEE